MIQRLGRFWTKFGLQRRNRFGSVIFIALVFGASKINAVPVSRAGGARLFVSCFTLVTFLIQSQVLN
jgi:hypothetical protein